MSTTTIIVAKTLVPRQYQGYQSSTPIEIKLDDSIKIIPRECFQGLKQLKKIVIPRSVRRIDFRAFANSGIKEVIFEEGSCLRVISARSFIACNDLTSVVIPQTIRIVGDFSFYGCKQLRNFQDKIQLRKDAMMIIPANVREIGAFAFARCGFTHGKISTPETKVFGMQQDNIATLDIEDPNNDSQPTRKNKLTENTNLSNDNDDDSSIVRSTSNQNPSHIRESTSYNVTRASKSHTNYATLNIGTGAFSRCKRLKSLTIPSSVKSIGKSTFANSFIEAVEFSQDLDLRTLPAKIFNECHSLKVVTFPTSMTSIGKSAFRGTGIESEVVAGMFAKCNIIRIDGDAFSGCAGLKSTTIPSSVKSIGEGVFFNSGIESVEFSHDSMLKIIPASLFESCENLKVVTLPPSITSIGRRSFYLSSIDDGLLEQISKSHKFTSIGECAFLGCMNIKSITIPSSVTTIGKDAFVSSSLEIVKFSQDSQIEIIPHSLFQNCMQLRSVTLPPSITSIGQEAFRDSSIDDKLFAQIFANCKITNIGNFAFSGCQNLRSILIPSTVKSIGKYAFCDSGVEDVEFLLDSQIETISEGLFQDSRLKIVKLPLSIKAINYDDFSASLRERNTFVNMIAMYNIHHIEIRF